MNDSPKYTLLQVADATDVSINTLRSWYQRGHIRIGLTDQTAEAKGLARYVSLQTAMAIGIAGVLVDMGIHPKKAAEAASKFAHSSSRCPETEIGRNPGHLWVDDEVTYTVLMLPASKNAPLQARVRRVPLDTTKFLDVFNSVLFGQNCTKGAIILILNDVVERIRYRLGLSPDEGTE